MRPRPIFLALSVAFLLGCHREMELRATYMNINGSAALFPCDKPNEKWRVHDLGLDADYGRLGGGRIFVRAYGTESDSGSIYGSLHTFNVRQILEVRAARPGECPGASDSALRALSSTPQAR